MEGRKRKRTAIETNPEFPLVWPPSDHTYPLVVQSILEETAFASDNPIIQRLAELARNAASIKIRIPRDTSAETVGDYSLQQSSSGETVQNDDAAGALSDDRPLTPTVQMLADGALAVHSDEHIDDSHFEMMVERSDATNFIKQLPASTTDISNEAKDPALGCDSTEELEPPEMNADIEIVRHDETNTLSQEIKPWEETLENWRTFDETFEDTAFEFAPAPNRQPSFPENPRKDALFWGTVSGGSEEVLGIEEQYRKVAKAESIDPSDAFGVDTLGWQFRSKSVIPGCKGIGRKELSTLRYEDLKRTFQPILTVGDVAIDEPIDHITIPLQSVYSTLGIDLRQGETTRLSEKKHKDVTPYVEAAISSIEREVKNIDTVETAMSILRHMMTEPGDNGSRVYDVNKILNPNPPLLRCVVLDMNENQFQGDAQPLGKAAALHTYQSLLPLVARYLSRPDPPSAPHRDTVPSSKRLKRAPNEENLPVKYPDTLNMLQICKFLTEHLLRDYALWQAWAESLNTDTRQSESELSKNHQKWNTVQRTIAAMTGGNDFNKANDIIAAWLRTHKNLTDPLGHARESWSLKLKDAMKESTLQWLSPISDDVYLTMDPYKPIHKGIPGHRKDIATAKAKALIHAPIAWTFPQAMPKMTSSNLIRHFRPDFRTGIFHARYFATEGIPYTSVPANNMRSTVHKTRIAAATLNKLKEERVRDDTAPAAANDSRTSLLWGVWTVQYPVESSALTEYNIRLSGGNQPSNLIGGAANETVHPADVLQTTDSLSLAEWCPMVLMEHTSQPNILPLPGMVGKIIRFYRPGKELYASPAQAEAKLQGRLGYFGSLRILGDRQPQLFGCPLRIKPSQGTSIMKTSVYAGMCLVHPFDPKRSLPTPEDWQERLYQSTRPQSAREGLTSLAQQDIDYRLTDFLLIRSGSYSTTNPKIKVTLRPLFYGYGQAGLDPQFQASTGSKGADWLKKTYGIREQVSLAMESYARTGIYTLGQLAPMTEIPTPDGKRINEWRKLWVEAYALRQSSCLDAADMTLNKTKCMKWFQGIFDNQVIQKILLPLKNSVEENTSVSFEKYLANNRLKTVNEEIIQKLLQPEQVCAIIAAQFGLVRLMMAGIRYLRTYDRLPVARTVLQQRDFASDAQWARLYAMWTRWQAKTGQSTPPGTTLFSLPPPYRGLNPSYHIQMSIVARIIEELIVLAPWNQWKCYQEISLKKNAQFLLGSTFDDSLGRGENVCFLKEDIGQQTIRDQIIPMVTKFIPDAYRQLPITRFGIDPTRLVIFEDSRRNVIQETNSQTLQIAVLRAGLSPNDVATMSRVELINAVYRFNFAITPSRGGSGGGRLDLGDYYSRINDIINRLRNTLQADTVAEQPAKDLTDVFEEAAHPRLDENALERSLAEGIAAASLGNEIESELMMKGEAKDDITERRKNVKMDEHAESRADLVCTPQQLIEHVWSLDSVLAPDSRLGAGPPMGLVTKEEGDKFEKELGEPTNDNKFVFPPSSTAAATAISSWLKGLPEGEIKDILLSKQHTAVPCLRWIRRTPCMGPATGGRLVNKDKIVLIYGHHNIQKFLEWRKRRLVSKYCKTVPADTSLNGSSVSAKRPGGSTTTTPAGTSKRSSIRTDASIVRKIMGTSSTSKRSASIASNVPPIKAESQTASAEDLAADDPHVDEASIVSRETRGCLPLTSIRLTSRQQRLLQERMENGGTEVVRFNGTPAQASEELNNNLAKLIMSLKKPEKKFIWFWDRVNEKDAPNYYSVVKNPMWLNLIQQKCVQKEYRSVKEFEDDILLVHTNCFVYNPDGHWIRPLAEQLVQTVQQKLRYQRLWLEEVEKHITK